MLNFIQRFGGNILGVLNGFDRIRFRGTRRFLANTAGMMNFLWQRQLLLKDFKAYAAGVTVEVRQAATSWRSMFGAAQSAHVSDPPLVQSLPARSIEIRAGEPAAWSRNASSHFLRELLRSKSSLKKPSVAPKREEND